MIGTFPSHKLFVMHYLPLHWDPSYTIPPTCSHMQTTLFFTLVAFNACIFIYSVLSSLFFFFIPTLSHPRSNADLGFAVVMVSWYVVGWLGEWLVSWLFGWVLGSFVGEKFHYVFQTDCQLPALFPQPPKYFDHKYSLLNLACWFNFVAEYWLESMKETPLPVALSRIYKNQYQEFSCILFAQIFSVMKHEYNEISNTPFWWG